MTTSACGRRVALGIAVLTACGGWATAQSRYAPAPEPPGRQAFLQQPFAPDSGYMNAHGESIVHPAMYGAPCESGYCEMGPGYCPSGPGGGGGGRCSNCLGAGCGACRSVLSFLTASSPVEQCGPHYFDFAAEFLHLNRDSPIDRVISTFSFTNPLPNGDLDRDAIANQAALRGEDIPGGDYDGFRLTGRLDVGALSVFEFSYSGLFTDESAATVRPDIGDLVTPGDTSDNSELFSIFSSFGAATNGAITVPATANAAGAPNATNQANINPGLVIDPDNPFFEETDAAEEHSALFDSELHTVEATLRRYWVGYNPRVSGTLLVGFRYTELQELLEFRSRNIALGVDGVFGTADDTEINSIAIDLEADNHLAGVQIGGDAWVTVLQGFRIGGEVKAGLYNNDHTVRARVAASDGVPSGVSRQSNNQVAFLTEAKAMAVVNITPSLALRGGYEVLFISDLALVGDNLTANPPYGADSLYGAAVPGLDAEGDVFWDGFNFGLEYTY